MGTKNNPGEFDCYANAEDDEPMFILLARDPEAPALVRRWAKMREAHGEPDVAMLTEAQECAEDMVLWRKEREARKQREDVLAARAAAKEPKTIVKRNDGGEMQKQQT